MENVCDCQKINSIVLYFLYLYCIVCLINILHNINASMILRRYVVTKENTRYVVETESGEVLTQGDLSEDELKQIKEEKIPETMEKSIKKSVLSDYYVQWLDMEIPMLGNISPRQASKTEDGRKKINELLDYMSRLPGPADLRPDPNAIRSALGIN